MTKIIGKQVAFGIAKEASRGVAESGADIWVQHNAFDVQDRVEKIVNESSSGLLVEGIGDTIAKVWSDGNVEFKVGDVSFGYLLMSLLGSVSTSANGDGTYKHTFTLNNSSQHPSLTLFRSDPQQDYTHANGMIDSLNLNVELGSYFIADVGFMAKKGVEASLTSAYVSENEFLPKHMTVKLADNAGDLDSASGICVQRASLNFAKNIVDEQCLGSLEPIDFYNTMISVDGSLEVYYDKKDHRDDLVNDVAKALRIQAVNSDVVIGSGSQNPEVTIDLNLVKYQATPIEFDNNNLVKQTIEFKGYYKVDDGALTTVELTNTQSSY